MEQQFKQNRNDPLMEDKTSEYESGSDLELQMREIDRFFEPNYRISHTVSEHIPSPIVSNQQSKEEKWPID